MDDLDHFLYEMLSDVDFARAYVAKLESNNQRLQAELDARFDRKVAEDILGTVQDLLDAGRRMHDTQRIQVELITAKDSEIEVLRAAIDSFLAEIDYHHYPIGKPAACGACSFIGGGVWPCKHRVALDALKEAYSGE